MSKYKNYSESWSKKKKALNLPVTLLCTICNWTTKWQKRGYNSLNGAVTEISIWLSNTYRNCKTCQSWEGREDSDEYEEFISTHELNCDINDHGSAGSVEADGLIECFQVSEKDRKLRYINYLGDGIQNRF